MADIPATGNLVVAIARDKGRDYITPEDVRDAFDAHPGAVDGIRRDVLEVLGGTAGVGAEDARLCAWCAFDGPFRGVRGVPAPGDRLPGR